MPQPSFLTAQLIVSIVVLLAVVHVMLIACAYFIYFERKISAYIQDRVGPNRTGFDFGLPFLAPLKGMIGLGQSLADGIKFLLKEDYAPNNVDKYLFTLAPVAIIIPALVGFAVIPWGGVWDCPTFTIPLLNWTIPGGLVLVTGAPVNVGVIFLLAVASLGVYGVTLGGWASNNKYSFLGGLRATAQMLAYEIPLGVSILCVLLLTGSLVPERIIGYQMHHGWLILSQPLAAVIFFLAILAEANRAPFDNAEAESELVGGYHTEYSAMRFALFFLAEYAHMFTSSAFFALLFLGGYHLPLIPGLSPEDVGLGAVIAKFSVYFLKVVAIVCFMMVVRWTVPRLRYDQVMMMGWQAVIPFSLAVMILTSVMVYFDLSGPIPMLLANGALLAAVLAIQPMLPRYNPNVKVPLYGSRFNPVPGERISTRPTDALALEDRPVEGSLAR
jgi:NADH-quinone oxidoreductase subunit H